MVNIFKSIGYSVAGLASLGWISFIMIGIMLAKPGDTWLTDFFANNLIMDEQLESFGRSFTDVSDGIFLLMAQMNIFLLIMTILLTIGWSAGSHYLNIDAPGKAKIYFIHWAIYTSILLALIAGVSLVFLTNSNFDNAFISAGGVTIIMIISIIYYFLIYYIGVLLGTARFARSSVLLANKLPGNL